MRHFLLILLTFGCVSVRAEEKVVAPDFSKYPQTESFRHYLHVHTNGAWVWQTPRTNLLVVSAFPSGGSYALQYFVSESGQESDHRNVYNHAIQASHYKQIDEANLTTLRSAIRELPAVSAAPSIERLVIVSFRDGTNLITRTYDSDALPKPMRQIYDIIGERFESRKDK
jgi:hypothetical protein